MCCQYVGHADFWSVSATSATQYTFLTLCVVANLENFFFVECKVPVSRTPEIWFSFPYNGDNYPSLPLKLYLGSAILMRKFSTYNFSFPYINQYYL